MTRYNDFCTVNLVTQLFCVMAVQNLWHETKLQKVVVLQKSKIRIFNKISSIFSLYKFSYYSLKFR